MMPPDTKSKHILLISADVVNQNMGGVGVRNWELAHALARHCRVTLAIPGETDLRSHTVRLAPYDLQIGDLRPIAAGADVIILHGPILHFHPYLRALGLPLVVDLYVPNLLENLVWHDQDDWDQWIPAYEEYLRLQLDLLRAGDFFFCASERQRDYWLGWLHAQKRINPHTYRQDPTLRKLIDVIPFGLPAEPLAATQRVLKAVHPGIGEGDYLLLWSGGLWDWLDPLTLIRSVGQLAPRYPALKLYFMGTHHPNPLVTGMSMPARAVQLSQELGLYEKSVFFGDWTPYEERGNYLAEADLAVVSHPGHIETRFSFRTRVLDCIWAGLPIVTTDGDAMADWVKQETLGLTVPPGEVDAMAQAIETMLLRPGGRAAYAAAFKKLQVALQWPHVVRSLVDFCMSPAKAPDQGLYRTEAERVEQAKDAFLAQVVQGKEEFLAQVVSEKDEFLGKVIREKDAFFEQAIQAKDNRIREQDAEIEHYRNLFPLRVYRGLKRLTGIK
jgi:glycosyltransferase involved in cell wall biosynthesis